MGAPQRNIELKARDLNPRRSHETCVTLGADHRGVLVQCDSYFNVLHGGLKLREETPGVPHLIQFEREDVAEQRLSSYRILPIADAKTCREALAATLGLGVIVHKRRELFIWQSVRIHLDEVRGLGRFVELEAVAAPDSDLTREHALVTELRAALSITDAQLQAHGYAHLLAGGARAPTKTTD